MSDLLEAGPGVLAVAGLVLAAALGLLAWNVAGVIRSVTWRRR